MMGIQTETCRFPCATMMDVLRRLSRGGYCQWPSDSDDYYALIGGTAVGDNEYVGIGTVDKLEREGYVRVYTWEDEPHLGCAKSVRLTDAGQEYVDAFEVEMALTVPRCYNCGQHIVLPLNTTVFSEKRNEYVMPDKYLAEKAESGGVVLCTRCSRDTGIIDKTKKELRCL